ncbi:uncharacterized protein MELLADRAFT_117255 [Melampsora larici-populina 98AG31]|uniref:CBS domain-containing protein n=1 Tax=Melampsora larici-populina (strain 98AG31 / pathotype 3-4-7) TaxID=747676 RepID=F4RV46_MELLP|nr:uncharacterized protein MELLADRAFT_117255 [Melampsora larici-populina 98AG31]EGG03814.1 hypothetical protein MELLADRAFT_117255 [Melampsora larici-populina 98AG31]
MTSQNRHPNRNHLPRPPSSYGDDLSSNLPSSSSRNSPLLTSETRQRQSRKDEAIRKKIENELQRKRPGQKRGPTGGLGHPGPRPRRQAGTVSALRPLPALTVPDNITVADASQLCAAKRTDCVLVVDEDEHLCGIFTAKDLAFRVIGDGLDPRSTLVSEIMTKNPMVTRDTTSATEALTTMVTRGFRHLPVCNEEGDVIGLLDITKVFHESLEKLERAYGSSQKLYNAIEGVQSEFGGSSNATHINQPNPLMAYVEALRDKMSFPDLGSILDARTTAATVGVKTSVKEAAKLMRDHHTTAVCVMENDGKKIAGIFTSKDVVLRVIAAGLDARTCSVVRVMTPHPDTALPSLSIQEALRKMHDGHYLNLPVVDEAGQLQGCVDVLKLTYATLEQVNSISADGQTDESGGPVWSRFFASLGQAGSVDDDAGSAISGSHLDASELPPRTPTSNRFKGQRHASRGPDTPGSELAPNDSASVIHDEADSALMSKSGVMSFANGRGGAPIEFDDGTYLFKFIAPSGSAHRFQARYDSYDFVREIIQGKLQTDPFILPSEDSSGITDQTLRPDSNDFQMSYFDDDNDLVLMTSDQDITDSVNLAKKQSKDRVVIHLKGGKTWGDLDLIKKKNVNSIIRLKAVSEAEEKEESNGIHQNDLQQEDQDDEDDEDQTMKIETTRKRVKKVQKDHQKDELVAGIPKDLVLPAAIGFLGFVILGVFLASKPSR